jgi:membrane protein YqaA with SNARE-associated domain
MDSRMKAVRTWGPLPKPGVLALAVALGAMLGSAAAWAVSHWREERIYQRWRRNRDRPVYPVRQLN